MSKKSGAIAPLNTARYEFWLTVAVALQVFVFLYVPVPFSNEAAILFNILMVVYARGNYIKEDFGLDDIAYLGVLLVAAIFIVGVATISAIKGLSFLELIAIGLVLDGISTVSGMVPIVGDILGAIAGFILVILLFGSKAFFIAGLASLLILIPGPLPVVTIALVGLKILLEVLF